jgi:hypothetical protein
MEKQSLVCRLRSSFLVVVTAAVLVASAALSVLASTAAPTVAAAATSQDWPMFLHDSTRSGATTDANLTTANVSNLKPAFTYKTGASIATSVSVVGTTAYVGLRRIPLRSTTPSMSHLAASSSCPAMRGATTRSRRLRSPARRRRTCR